MPSPARLLALALTALLAADALGCAYARDRVADLADVFTLEAGLGYGLHADVKATDWLHVGLGYAHVRKLGFRGRDLTWLPDREVGLPASGILAVGAWRDGGYDRLAHLHASLGDLLSYEDPWRRADLEVGVTAAFVSLRVGLSPGHLADFLAGLVGFDPAGDDRGLPFEDPAEPGSVWLAGDLHEHCEPPDRRGHAPITPEDAVAIARGEGLDFCGLDPHLWTRTDASSEPVRDFAARAVSLCASTEGPIVIPGYEVTSGGGRLPGHALLLFRRPEALLAPVPAGTRGDAYLRLVLEALPPGDRLFAPTHPRRARGEVRIPFFPDWADTWDPVAEEAPPPLTRAAGPLPEEWAQIDFDGLEDLTLLLHLGEVAIGRSGEDLATADVARYLDRRIAATRRRYTMTGGSDNHRDIVIPTTWALCRERSRDGVFDALLLGRVCVGGPEAGSLEARTDLDPAWRAIGSDLRASRWLEARWRGAGRLIVDGKERPESRGPVRIEVEAGAFHFLRLEAGPGGRSRSGWIYFNRPGTGR